LKKRKAVLQSGGGTGKQMEKKRRVKIGGLQKTKTVAGKRLTGGRRGCRAERRKKQQHTIQKNGGQRPQKSDGKKRKNCGYKSLETAKKNRGPKRHEQKQRKGKSKQISRSVRVGVKHPDQKNGQAGDS